MFQVNPETGYIDYDRLQENARLFHPKMIIAGIFNHVVPFFVHLPHCTQTLNLASWRSGIITDWHLGDQS